MLKLGRSLYSLFKNYIMLTFEIKRAYMIIIEFKIVSFRRKECVDYLFLSTGTVEQGSPNIRLFTTGDKIRVISM